jgi:archaeal flagellar protein FlaJ
MIILFLKENIFTKKNLFLFFIIYMILFLLFLLFDSVVISLNMSYLVTMFFMYFIVHFFVIFFLYKIKLKDVERRINKEIPFFLNNLANDLDKNISLKLALENRVDESLIGEKIKLVLYKVNIKGFSLSESLESVGVENTDLKRVFYQIDDILVSGSKNKADALKTLADSIIEKQNYLLKNYSTKLGLLSLIYIVVSAIVPALFLMFLLVGSNFLEISFSPITIIFVIVILFPIIDMFIFLIMKSNLP